jgi:hypothetical protein
VRGGCRPEATTIVSASNDCGQGQVSLAVADGVLYWTSALRGTVERIGVDGSARRMIAAGETRPGAIAVLGSSLFWVATDIPLTEPDGGLPDVRAAIRQVTLPAGAPADAVVEVGQAPVIPSLAASDDGQTLYYAAGNQVRALSVAGGSATTVVAELSGDALLAFAVEGTSFAFLVADRIELASRADGAAAMCDYRSGADIVSAGCALAQDGMAPEVLPALVLKAGKVYWSGGTTVSFAGATTALARASGQIAVASSGTRVTGLVGGRDALFFADADLVERASYLPGFEAIPLARGQRLAGSLAVDATRVYWVNYDCSIVSTPID